MSIKKVTVSGILIVVGSLIFWFSCSANSTAKVASSHAEMVKRGEYLVATIGCTNCHTPRVETAEGLKRDETRFLAGHPQDMQISPDYFKSFNPDLWGGVFTREGAAWVGPWGVSFATNLTPDTLSGIGAWNEEVFIRAMRDGKHMGGIRVTRPSYTMTENGNSDTNAHASGERKILPPMPWESYAKLSDDDLKSIFAYLRTIKPVENMVPMATSPLDTK